MVLPRTTLLAVINTIADEPTVYPVESLVALGLPDRDMRILAANHTGEPVPGGSGAVGETSTDRYKGTSFAPDPSIYFTRGVYSPDLLLWLAGKHGVSLTFPTDSAEANIAYAKERLLSV